MLTVIWHIKAMEENIFDPELPALRFDVVLAIVAFLTLIKLFFQFEYTPSFGPLYKMMQRLFNDLMKFIVIWMIQLVCFASVAVLCFGNLDTFRSFNSSVIYFIEASLGEYRMTHFDQSNKNMSNLGYYFHIIFLLINIILMLNLVIAILSQSFQNLASYTNGLYCDTLVKSFAAAEWHDHYGCLACASTPF